MAEVFSELQLRLKLRGSNGVPCPVVNTGQVSIQPSPARALSAFRCSLRSLSAVTQVGQLAAMP